jgi:hypothetical protein
VISLRRSGVDGGLKIVVWEAEESVQLQQIDPHP